MIEKYFYMDCQTARDLLDEIKHMEAAKRGIDRHAFLFGDYAVLSTCRLKLRNVVTRDDDLAYLDEIIYTLYKLRERGVAVVPILGYCYDPDSESGDGYIIQQRAKGEELYDDAILKEYYVGKPYLSYLSSDVEPEGYILSRTEAIAKVPQKHFDKFVSDMIVLMDHDLLVDFNGKSNFFYDETEGFQFIDLDSHTDYKYGLTDRRMDGRELAAYYGFTPCHYGEGTGAFSHIALSEQAIRLLGSEQLHNLKMDNQIIFEKCKTALKYNGLSDNMINSSLKQLKIFGS